MKIRIGIIGCGQIGEKRAQSILSLKDSADLVGCADLNIDKSRKFSNKYSCIHFDTWRKIINHENIDLVIIATTHDALAEVAKVALLANKNVLLEKPGGRNSQEVLHIIDILSRSSVKLHVGFNHRYHRSIQRAKQIIDSGNLGELMLIRARYGHGGRIGYDKEWRADPQLSGGGELMDQGPHIIDLCRWFLGDFESVDGYASTLYWDMPVDDNAFLLLKTKEKRVAFFHVSCTEWKNTFSMEIYGRLGKIELSGLGGSYGVERISHYQMSKEMGPPLTEIWEYPMKDNSWDLELEEFIDEIKADKLPSSNIYDALECHKIIEKIYKNSNYDYCT